MQDGGIGAVSGRNGGYFVELSNFNHQNYHPSRYFLTLPPKFTRNKDLRSGDIFRDVERCKIRGGNEELGGTFRFNLGSTENVREGGYRESGVIIRPNLQILLPKKDI